MHCQYRRKRVIFLLVAGALHMHRQRTISAWLSGGTRETPAQRHIGHIHLVTSWRTCDTRHRPQMWQAQRARTVSLRGSVAPHLARDLRLPCLHSYSSSYANKLGIRVEKDRARLRHARLRSWSRKEIN